MENLHIRKATLFERFCLLFIKEKIYTIYGVDTDTKTVLVYKKFRGVVHIIRFDVIPFSSHSAKGA